MKPIPLKFQMAWQLETWISPLKVRVATVAHWGENLVGERMVHHTVHNPWTLEANQFAQSASIQWLALGSLLHQLHKHQNKILPRSRYISPIVHITTYPGVMAAFEDLVSYGNLEVIRFVGGRFTTSNDRRKQDFDTRPVYVKRCGLLVKKFKLERPDIQFLLTIENRDAAYDAKVLLCDKAVTQKELLGLQQIGKRISRLTTDKERESVRNFHTRLTPGRRRIRHREDLK